LGEWLTPLRTFVTSDRKPFNPCYALLVLVGVAFSVTACAYGVMTVRDMRATAPTPPDAPGEPLMQWLREHGVTALMIEVGLLAVTSVGAMATDDYWTRRAARRHSTSQAPSQDSHESTTNRTD